MQVIIRDLADCSQTLRAALVEMIKDGFGGLGSDYETYEGAQRPLKQLREPSCIARVAFSEDEAPIGLIGGLPEYHGHVFELHPLVVAVGARGRGVGRALVADLECEAAKRGASTLWLGSDDHDCRTSIGGVDLYPDVLGKLAAIRNTGGHPFRFYLKVGFTIVGTLPDANGPGKPDIFMAKRLKPAA
ncbi:MAG: GNAT family N-acetyltransferase [Alphaproteobacteria bacterium]